MNPNANLNEIRTDRHSVLIIEDSPDQMLLMEDLISLLGYPTKAVSNATKGLEYARTLKPRVIICDIGLPDMSGLEFARRVRADEQLQDTCLIALSGFGAQEQIDASLHAGFDQHLLKPVSIAIIQEVLAGILDS